MQHHSQPGRKVVEAKRRVLKSFEGQRHVRRGKQRGSKIQGQGACMASSPSLSRPNGDEMMTGDWGGKEFRIKEVGMHWMVDGP